MSFAVKRLPHKPQFSPESRVPQVSPKSRVQFLAQLNLNDKLTKLLDVVSDSYKLCCVKKKP